MITECIHNIELKTNNQDIISVSNCDFSHFYIANIDNDGDEINYTKKDNSNTLLANFFMVKIANNKMYVERLKNCKDIISVGISFNNGYYQEFEIAKKRIANNGKLENIYESIIDDDNNDLCIIISNKNIKYKKGLFI